MAATYEGVLPPDDPLRPFGLRLSPVIAPWLLSPIRRPLSVTVPARGRTRRVVWKWVACQAGKDAQGVNVGGVHNFFVLSEIVG